MNFLAFNSLSRLAMMVLFVGFFNSVKAQDTTNATIDSLIILLMNDEEDELRVDVYTALSDEYLSLDYSKSLNYSLLAQKLSEELDYTEGILDSKMALANINLAFLLDYPVAKKYYRDALPIAQSLKDEEAEMKIYRGLSYIYGAMKNFEMAKSYNTKAMEIAESLDNYQFISDLNSYMGGLFEDSGDTAKAIEYYADVLAIEKKNDFRETSNSSMISIARYYFLTDDHKQALKYYRIALKNFERLNDHRWVSYTHSEMAKLYVFDGDLKRAELHALKGLEIAETNKLKKELGDNYLALEQIYTEMDSLEKAEEYARAYDSLQDTLKSEDVVSEVIEQDKKGTENIADNGKTNGFLMALIILLPVILVVIFTGMPSKKK